MRATAALALVALAGIFAASGSSGPVPVPRFKHVIVVVFENHGASQVLHDPAAPTFRHLAERYATLANYDAVAHPSLPNYLALVAGSTFGLDTDCTRCVVDAPNLADTLAARSLTWKTYVEDIPRELDRVHSAGVKARIPFLFFRDVLSAPRRMHDIVPLADFRRDLQADRLPSFSLVIPDLCHDMHDCSVATGDRWLESFMDPLLNPGELRRSVVFITFDEAERPDDRGGGGQVPALVVGPRVRPDSVSTVPLNHYSLLRTIEDAWKLRPLGLSATAQPITGIWR
jgi:phosphatidylinositol-3-phosphatase